MFNQFTIAEKKLELLAENLISSIERIQTDSSKKHAVKTYTKIIENHMHGAVVYSILDNIDLKSFEYNADDILDYLDDKKQTDRCGNVFHIDNYDKCQKISSAIHFVHSIESFT